MVLRILLGSIADSRKQARMYKRALTLPKRYGTFRATCQGVIRL